MPVKLEMLHVRKNHNRVTDMNNLGTSYQYVVAAP